MDLSIIIPTYNRKDVLRHNLLSLIDQGLLKYEVIVCDDGSNDGTKEMVNSLQTPYNIEYLFQEKRGFRAASARNMGIKAAKSENILFIDQDIISHPKILQIFLDNSQDKHYCCGIKKFVPLDFYHKNVINDDFNCLTREYFGFISATLSSYSIMKKKDLESVDGFDEEFDDYGLEDTELIDRFKDIGITGSVETKCIGYHIEHQANTLSKKSQDLYHWKRENKSGSGKKVIDI